MPISAAPTPTKRLNPVFDIDSARVAMVTQFLSAVPASILRTPVVSLVQHDTEIIGSLDMALTGV